MVRQPGDVLDELLVLQSQRGDAKSLNLLARRWHKRLLYHAYRLTGQTDAAPEITQEAWVAIVRNIRKLKETSRFGAWSYRIVANKSADWIRREQRQRSVASEAADAAAVMPASDSGDVQTLRTAMKDLSDEDRMILSMFYMEGFSVREIARALSVPEGTIKSRLFRAREHLKKVLEA